MSVLTVKTRHQESVTEWETHPTQHRIIIKECGCKLVTLRLKTKIYKYNLGRVGGGVGSGWEKPAWSRSTGISDKSGSRWVTSYYLLVF